MNSGGGKGPEAGPVSSTPRARRSRSADVASVLAAYGLVGIGIWFYSRSALARAPRLPGLEESLPLLLIGLVPLALLVVFSLRARSLVVDVRKRRYGSRLRLRLSLLFLAVGAAASLPQAAFLLQLAWGAQSWPAGKGATKAIGGGLSLVLDYYAEDLERLKRLASMPLRTEGRGGEESADARSSLAALRELEPRVDSVEFFREGASVAFAGAESARLYSAPAAGTSGWLPTATDTDPDGGQVTRLRYARPAGAGIAVVSMRLPPRFQEAAADLSRARDEAALMEPFSFRWARILALLYLFLVLPLLLLAAILGLAAADLVAEPLVGLEAATRRVAAGDFGVRLLAKPGDETGRLAAAFNRMLDGIERRSEGDQRQGRLDAWRDIAQRLAHELKNPLTPIRLAAERVLRLSRSDPERAREILEDSMLAVVAEVEGMDALLADFRSFASLPEPQRDWAELAQLVEEATAVWRASHPEVEFDLAGLPAPLPLRVDRAQFRRAMGNLVANAIDAMDGKGRITIAADLVKAAESRYCRIRIADSGKGIPPGVGGRVFDPYFTTKSSGTGLGLSIVERIIEDHGGSIRFESEDGAGTTFIIDLPADR
jgi:nitrogen fixation/metabolism regulation signal transduction histidine kinase